MSHRRQLPVDPCLASHTTKSQPYHVAHDIPTQVISGILLPDTCQTTSSTNVVSVSNISRMLFSAQQFKLLRDYPRRTRHTRTCRVRVMPTLHQLSMSTPTCTQLYLLLSSIWTPMCSWYMLSLAQQAFDEATVVCYAPVQTWTSLQNVTLDMPCWPCMSSPDSCICCVLHPFWLVMSFIALFVSLTCQFKGTHAHTSFPALVDSEPSMHIQATFEERVN